MCKLYSIPIKHIDWIDSGLNQIYIDYIIFTGITYYYKPTINL